MGKIEIAPLGSMVAVEIRSSGDQMGGRGESKAAQIWKEENGAVVWVAILLTRPILPFGDLAFKCPNWASGVSVQILSTSQPALERRSDERLIKLQK